MRMASGARDTLSRPAAIRRKSRRIALSKNDITVRLSVFVREFKLFGITFTAHGHLSSNHLK